MSSIWLDLPASDGAAEFLETGRLREGLRAVASLGGAELVIRNDDVAEAGVAPPSNPVELPVRYLGCSAGRILYQEGLGAPSPGAAASTICTLLEHMLEREAAVSDLAKEMIGSYEELTMLYSLLPNMASLDDMGEIGRLLVRESARILNCRRVSLLVLDERKEKFTVLASLGLPPEAENVIIPVSGSIAGHAFLADDLLVVNDLSDHPDLAAMSQGTYDSAAFSIVRVPLRAQGDPIGVLTATEREDGDEFTARERKLLAGLSAVGSSALMNCHLHAVVNRQMLGTIEALALAVDAKDPYTHDHSTRVSELCVATLKKFGVHEPKALREMLLAGMLHDIGKIGVRETILTKKGRLTPEEFAMVKRHADVGARIVGRVKGLERVTRAILHHHERSDGLGYPSGLSGDEIPMMAKVIAVADVFDCLTSDRPYRAAMTHAKAVAELRRCKATQFDPAVVESFLAAIEEQPCPQEQVQLVY